MSRSRIVGTGMYVPDRVVTNDELATLMDTSDEWIQQRSGIQERRYIAPDQMPADLAALASEQALEAAGLEVGDLDCILLATLSPQAEFPSTSFFLHEKLDAGVIPCMDIRAQCSGFLYSLAMADGLIQAGHHKRVLVVGCEVHSRGLEFADRGRDVTVLFGDGAGAVILEACEEGQGGLLEIRMHSEGKHAKRLWLEAPGMAIHPFRFTPEMIEDGRAFPKMDGRFVFKHAVTRMQEVLRETLDAASLKLDDVDHFFFHQANLRINEMVAAKLEIPGDKCLNNIQQYGNCSAAAIPILLAEAARAGKLESGSLSAMTAFGSGFTWASALHRW